MKDIVISYSNENDCFLLPLIQKFYFDFINTKEYNFKELTINSNPFYFYGLSSAENDFIVNDDEIIFVVFGDIFLKYENYKRNNTKDEKNYIFNLYKKYPNSITDFIKGNFLLIAFSKKEKLLTVINNRFGITPVYYSLIDRNFILSTNLKIFQKLFSKSDMIDESALVERELFNYTIGDKTLIKNVCSLKPSEIITYKQGKLESTIYWNPGVLYDSEIMNEKEAIITGERIFKHSVNIRTSDNKIICASLTGGFDGRTILSVLNKDLDLKLYSFGIEGSLNITIPQKIAKDLDLNYEPILLDKEYEKEYPRFAEEVVLNSDCLRTIESANYPYAFKKLSYHSDVVVTGIFGSELLRTFQNVGLMVTDNFVSINDSNNSPEIWKYLEKKLLENSYLDRKLIIKNLPYVKENFDNSFWNNYKHLTKNQRFYIYLMLVGLRGYFGGEVHSERFYATNRFPFLDDDFVEFIFKSPFAGVYSNALKPTPNQRFRSQYFYSKIIERNRPELLKYQTDHGFPAGYVLSKFPLLKIALPYLINTNIKKLKKYREFKPVEWGELYFKEVDSNKFLNSYIFNEKLKYDYLSKKWKINYKDFFKAVSFNIWLNS